MTDDNVPSDPIDPADGLDPALPPTEPLPVTEPVVAATAQPPLHDPHAAMAAPPPDPRWYDNTAVTGAVIAAGLLGLFLLIGWLIWWSDDDEDDAAVIESTTTVVLVQGSTVTSPSTIPEATITEGSTIVVTLPESTTTTTTTIPVVTAPTTVPPTTVPPTTVAPTTAPPTTAPETTTTVPVVTVPDTGGASAFDIIANSPDLSRLNQLIVDAGLQDELSGEGPLTLFAPSNPALETLEAAPGGAELLADPERLQALLLRHVVGESLTAADVLDRVELSTASGETLVIDADAQTVDGASLLVADVVAGNGVIHVVDQVLIP